MITISDSEFIQRSFTGVLIGTLKKGQFRNEKEEDFTERLISGGQPDLYVNMHIEEYAFGTRYNHRPKAQRKLLLNKKELKKLHREVQNSGLTIVPLRLFITDKGFAKVRIALARGKKLYDKRETIKDRDNKRDLDRIKKSFKR